MIERLPVVAVIGSGVDEHAERAEPLGRWLATVGVHLLTGGGRGVMTAVSRAFAAVPGRRGLVLGVIPSADEQTPQRPKEGYPNPWVEVPILTHLPHSGPRGQELGSRNHIVILSAAVVVALPGGAGTASEAGLAVRYGRPIVACLRDRSELPGLPPDVRIEPEFEQVTAFVTANLQPDAGTA
jgi:uncharacterized protein (TIGR00725 family)